MLLNCGVEEDSWESLGLQEDQTSQFKRKSILNIHWKDWCWSWSSNTLVTWCKELTHLKRPWCWERFKAGRDGDDKGWDTWMARISDQLILEEINPEYSLEGLMLKQKLRYFGYLMWGTDSLEKTLMLEQDWRQEEKGMIEVKMVGWHHWFDGPEFEQALGFGDGQGSLVCCSPWGHKELDTTEQLNWTELILCTL